MIQPPNTHRPVQSGQPEFLLGDYGFWRWRRYDEEQMRFETSRENYSSLELCQQDERRTRGWRWSWRAKAHRLAEA